MNHTRKHRHKYDEYFMKQTFNNRKIDIYKLHRVYNHHSQEERKKPVVDIQKKK